MRCFFVLYPLFLLTVVADCLLSYHLLGPGREAAAAESNPLMARILAGHGWPAVLWVKAGLAAFVAGVLWHVASCDPRISRWLRRGLALALILAGCTVLYEIALAVAGWS